MKLYDYVEASTERYVGTLTMLSEQATLTHALDQAERSGELIDGLYLIDQTIKNGPEQYRYLEIPMQSGRFVKSEKRTISQENFKKF